jgi:SAM-dependent methyltransferase
MIDALGIAMVKNEADVIEAFVRHNLSFMDALAIVDNDSIDGTREILVELQRQGLRVILFDDPVVGHFQAEIVTAVYRRVVPQFKPRFVFLLDADEFVVANREALYDQLRALNPGTEAQYAWRTYIPAPTGPEGGDAADPLRSIVHRKLVEDQRWWKPVVVTSPKIDTRLKVKQGNHGVRCAGRPLRKVKLKDAAIAHFPVRSVDQFTSKILIGWIANLERNRYRLDVGHAIHWKKVYERIVRGPAFTAADLTEEALRYAQLADRAYEWPRDVVRDPVEPAYGELTAGRFDRSAPLQKVVTSIDRILNPESDISYVAAETKSLRNLQQNGRRWRLNSVQSIAARVSRTRVSIDLPPLRYISRIAVPESVLDIGCTSGVTLQYFASRGARRTLGVVSAQHGDNKLDYGEWVSADLGKPLDLGETFDLVTSLGVAAHIPDEAAGTFVSSIVRHARNRVLFSCMDGKKSLAAGIACRPISYWLDLFAQVGWYPCEFDSLALRSLSTVPWFSNHLVMLTRDDSGAGPAAERLVELDEHPVKTPKHWPALIVHPFADIEPRLNANRRTRLIGVVNARLRPLLRRILD